MKYETEDTAAVLRAWAKRAGKVHGLHDMREALNAAAIRFEQLQDQVRGPRAIVERGKDRG